MSSIVRDHHHYISSFCEFESWFFCALCIDSLSLWKVKKYLGEKNKSMKYLKMSSLIFFLRKVLNSTVLHKEIGFKCLLLSLPNCKVMKGWIQTSCWVQAKVLSARKYIYMIWIKISVEHITEENSYSRTPKLVFYKVITFAVKISYIHMRFIEIIKN